MSVEHKASTKQLEEVNSRLAKGEGWIGYRSIAPKYLYYAFYINGKQKFVNSKTNDVEDAYRQLLAARGVVERGITVLPSEVGRLRYEHLRAAYIGDEPSRENIKLSQLDRFFAGTKAASITTDIIRKYIAHRRKTGIADATIRRELNPLRAMFNLAVKSKKLSSDQTPYFPMPKDSEPAGEYITPEQFEVIRTNLPDGSKRGAKDGGPKSTTDLQPFFTFLYATGCRLGATQEIMWDHVDKDCSTIRIPAINTKTKKPLQLPLEGELLEPIAKELRKRFHDNRPVFDSTNYRPEWAKACAKAGVGTWDPKTRKRTGVRIHDCRCSGAINLLDSGVNEGLVLKIGGWKTRAMLDRYNVTSRERLSKAMRQAGRYVVDRMKQATVN